MFSSNKLNTHTIMAQEYRYRKNRGLFIPERKDKQGNWIGFDFDNMDNTMQNFVRSLTNYDKDSKTRSSTFSDSKDIYFREEFLLKAFLAGAREYSGTEISEFDIFDEKTG